MLDLGAVAVSMSLGMNTTCDIRVGGVVFNKNNRHSSHGGTTIRHDKSGRGGTNEDGTRTQHRRRCCCRTCSLIVATGIIIDQRNTTNRFIRRKVLEQVGDKLLEGRLGWQRRCRHGEKWILLFFFVLCFLVVSKDEDSGFSDSPICESSNQLVPFVSTVSRLWSG